MFYYATLFMRRKLSIEKWKRILFVYKGVAPVEGDVRNYHQAVEQIQIDDKIKIVKDFMQYARRVAEQDNEKKDNAFARILARSV